MLGNNKTITEIYNLFSTNNSLNILDCITGMYLCFANSCILTQLLEIGYVNFWPILNGRVFQAVSCLTPEGFQILLYMYVSAPCTFVHIFNFILL